MILALLIAAGALIVVMVLYLGTAGGNVSIATITAETITIRTLGLVTVALILGAVALAIAETVT